MADLGATGSPSSVAAPQRARLPAWPLPPDGAVDVHRVELDPGEDAVARCRVLLSGEERARADAFVFARDARRYTVAHGVLRAVLGRYADVAPHALRFATGRWGKPYLVDHPELRFNLTHSGDLALLAVTDRVEVGIDVEAVREDTDLAAVREVFTAAERAALDALPAAAAGAGVLRCWARKEACLKAVGRGFSLDPATFSVAVEGEATGAVAGLAAAPEGGAWFLYDVSVGAGFVAALAAPRPGLTLRRCEAVLEELVRTPGAGREGQGRA